MNELIALCYGVKISKTDLYDLISAQGYTDFYKALYSLGLEYKIIGHQAYSDVYVVGRCIAPEVEGGCVKLEHVDDNVYAFPFEYQFATEKIRELLIKLGIKREPEFLLVMSYYD